MIPLQEIERLEAEEPIISQNDEENENTDQHNATPFIALNRGFQTGYDSVSYNTDPFAIQSPMTARRHAIRASQDPYPSLTY